MKQLKKSVGSVRVGDVIYENNCNKIVLGVTTVGRDYVFECINEGEAKIHSKSNYLGFILDIASIESKKYYSKVSYSSLVRGLGVIVLPYHYDIKNHIGTTKLMIKYKNREYITGKKYAQIPRERNNKINEFI